MTAYIEASTAPLKNTGSIKLYSAADFDGMRNASQVTARCLDELSHIIRPGTSTKEIDDFVAEFGRSNDALPATLNYQATPALMKTAFLSTKTVNTTKYPFLAGSLNVFLENKFIAADKIKTVMPNENLQLSLGADEGISIKRTLLNRFTENNRVFRQWTPSHVHLRADGEK